MLSQRLFTARLPKGLSLIIFYIKLLSFISYYFTSFNLISLIGLSNKFVMQSFYLSISLYYFFYSPNYSTIGSNSTF